MTATEEGYAARPYVRTLGEVAIVGADDAVTPVSRTQRRILLRLAVAAPQIVHRAELADAVWPEGRPATAKAAIQNQISRLRAAVGEDAITTVGDGYGLALETDVRLLRALAIAGQRSLAAGDDDGAHGRIFRALDRLLSGMEAEITVDDGGWGRTVDEAAADPGFDDHVDDSGADYLRGAQTVITTARAVRLALALAAGDWAWALIEAEAWHARDPLDEQVAANYARALALAGRRSEALSMLARVRRELRLRLGVDSGLHLDGAEHEILSGQVGRGGDELAMIDRVGSPRLAGRGYELRTILQHVAKRDPVRVRGEHGSGVSRLLFETRARLISLGVRAILVRAEENPDSATSLIEELLAELGIAVESPRSVLATFEATVAGLDGDPPTVFLIDDVQFLGPSAWQAIRAVAAAAFGGLVLGGHRQVVELPGQVEVDLGPLDNASVAAMARHWGVTDPEEAAGIVAVSGGNPLAVRLIVAQSHAPEPRSAAVSAEPAGYGTGLDTFIDRLIGARAGERLDDLRLAAVAGDGYPRAAFDHLDWPHAPQPPTDLIDMASGTIRFLHGAVQDHLYRSIPRGVVLDMHYALGMAARAASAGAGVVARHLLAAAELDPAAAVAAARDAAAAAGELGAHADAAEWLRQARDVVDEYFSGAAAPGVPATASNATADRPTRADILRIELEIGRGDALRLAGHPDHMAVLSDAARAALVTGVDRLIAAAGFALLQLGGSSPAGALDDDLVALMGRVINSINDPEIAAPVQAAASLAWSMTGHAEVARALFDAAEGAARSATTRLQVLPFAYLALGLPDDLPRRRALADELADLAVALADTDALWEAHQLHFSVAIQLGDGAWMQTELARMEGLVERLGDVGTRWCTLYCAATAAEMAGDAVRAEELAEQAYRTFVRISPERAAAAYYAQLLPLRIRDGRLAELWPVVEGLLATQPGVTGWHAAAALILADTDRDAATEHAALTLELAQHDFTYLAAHVIGGRAAALLADSALARRYVDRLEPWADLVCWQGTCSYGPVSEVLAMLYGTLGDDARAATARVTAQRLASSLRAGAPITAS